MQFGITFGVFNKFYPWISDWKSFGEGIWMYTNVTIETQNTKFFFNIFPKQTAIWITFQT